MSSSNKPSFEEHQHFRAWRRFHRAAAAEKEWMHQRLGWLFAAQAFLFAAYGLILQQGIGKCTAESSPAACAQLAVIEWLVPRVALALNVLGLLGTAAAARMHWRWTTSLNDAVTDLQNPGVLTFGTKPYWPARTSSLIPPLISFIFCSAWLGIIFYKDGWPALTVGVIAALLPFVCLALLRFLDDGQSHQLFERWHAGVSYVWKSDRQVTDIIEYQPNSFLSPPPGVYVFDFDGVVCSGLEEKIYSLSPHMTDWDSIEEGAKKWVQKCDDMDPAYRRHLVYQAAAYQNEMDCACTIEPGKAFELFKRVNQIFPTFTLSARAGFYAVARQQAFLSQNNSIPVETFQVGRVSKDRQISKLLAEFPASNIWYFDDKKSHLESALKSADPEHFHRLRAVWVSPDEIETSEARDHLVNVMSNALRKPNGKSQPPRQTVANLNNQADHQS